MESTQNLKKRIKSVANINKITKAMELVAATKMRRAQEIALASRPYAFTALDLLANLTLLETELPELLKQRKIKKVLFVLVASDKGLAGAFNSSLFRKFEQHMKGHAEKYKNEEKFFIAVGEKSFNYLSKKPSFASPSRKATDEQSKASEGQGINIVKKFVNAGDFTTLEQARPLTDFIVEGYLRGAKKWPASNPPTSKEVVAGSSAGWDRVVVFSTHFRSALKQEALVRRVLPVDFEHIKETVQEIVPETGKFAELIKESFGAAQDKPKFTDYLIEPSPAKVLENLVRHLFFMQVYHLILEANASEHSARRLAMKTASDNASDLGQALNLQYNKSRQGAITKEIIEITAGAESLS